MLLKWRSEKVRIYLLSPKDRSFAWIIVACVALPEFFPLPASPHSLAHPLQRLSHPALRHPLPVCLRHRIDSLCKRHSDHEVIRHRMSAHRVRATPSRLSDDRGPLLIFQVVGELLSS